MNYKQLFPTYRNRFLFIERALKTHGNETDFKAANFGCGEGELDTYFLQFCADLTSIDINTSDINFASKNNANHPQMYYKVADVLNSNFPASFFDIIISTEVLEHVGRPDLALNEIHRVLKSGGVAILTFPITSFPLTYDPINYLRQKKQKKAFSIGAYSFGHEYLIQMTEFEAWTEELGFEILKSQGLSYHLIGFLEMYWTGIVQSIFKHNSGNVEQASVTKYHLRPGDKIPLFVGLTDLIIALDKFFNFGNKTIGRGVVLRKK